MTRADVASFSVVGLALIAGESRGPVVRLGEPLSFWGGFDAETGLIIDRRHPNLGRSLAGRIVLMHAARGSSSGSSVLAEAIRRGTAPAGFVLATRDAILTVGAAVALELYGRACPIAVVSPDQLVQLGAAAHVSVTCQDGRALVAVEQQPG
jgi:uncharacterized protein